MDVNKIGAISQQFQVNKSKKAADAPMSFQELMQLRLGQQSAAPAAADAYTLDAIYRAGGIEAVSARSRVQHSTGGDVTDFLGLMNQDVYISAQDTIAGLVDTGAISAADAGKLGYSVFPAADDLMGYLLNEPGFTDLNSIDPNDSEAMLEAMINNEQFTYGHILGKYGKQATSVQELAESHSRVLAALRVNNMKNTGNMEV